MIRETTATEFETWSIQRGRPDLGFPPHKDAHQTSTISKWFREHDRYIAPNASYTVGTLERPRPPHSSRNPNWTLVHKYRWEELGDLVQPGDWISMLDGGHCTFFLYWLRRNPDQKSIIHNTFQGLTDDLKLELPEESGSFSPIHDINWFRAINGNQGGAVTLANYAIVSLPTEHESWIPYLVGDETNNYTDDLPGVMIWCEKERSPDYHDGFGRLSARD